MTPKTRILLVEDDLVLTEIIRAIFDASVSLRIAGHATSAGDALQLAEFERFDAALVDVVLVGQDDGIDLAARLRRKHALPSVLMTGYLGMDVIERSIQARPLGFLAKPLSFDNLVGAMEHYLSLRSHVELP